MKGMVSHNVLEYLLDSSDQQIVRGLLCSVVGFLLDSLCYLKGAVQAQVGNTHLNYVCI